jgi:hypothetical protein
MDAKSNFGRFVRELMRQIFHADCFEWLRGRAP